MGVLGLWQLLAPVGQPVTLESLENKIFAVDISIWLNQAIKGYRDSQGGSLPNAHLLSLFSRLCKLLFYKIRPIIVFDGGFPELKKQTIINRQNKRAAVKQSSRDIGLKILTNYVASQNLAQGSGETSVGKNIIRPKEKVRDEIYKLPPLPDNLQENFSESAEDAVEWKFTNFSKEDIKYLNKIDIESDDFNDLPPDVKQEILSTLKESRKHRTWEQSRELPEDSNEFSNYQMQCLLKKRNLSRKLEQVQKDMRQINAADFVAQYTSDHVLGETNKIMSDDCSHYVLLKKIMKSTNQSSPNENSEEASSSMMDTKSAFIKDMENIDVMNDFHNQASQREISEESGEGFVKNSFDSFTEEDVDNPPEALQTQTNIIKKEVSKEKESSSNSFEVVLSSEDEEDMLAKARNVRNAEIEGSDQVVRRNSKKLVEDSIETLPLKYQALTESYLENVMMTVSSSDDEMIPCDEIPAESLFARPVEDSIENLPLKYPVLTESYLEKDITVSSSDDEIIPCDEIPAESLFARTCKNQTELKENNFVLKKANNSSANLEQKSCNAIEHVDLPEDNKIKVNKKSPIKFNDSNVITNSTHSSVTKKVLEIDVEESVLTSSFVPSTSFSSTSSLPSTLYIPSTSTDDSYKQNLETTRRNLELQQELDTATLLLEADQAKLDRQNRTVQDHMIEECKELLRLFGIPFIVSPTEAEAQCAFYDMTNLSHGTITDDSDVWLFGGKRVYKNFFTQQKYVEFYKDHEIFTHFGLSRGKLINFALLTGSDYTEGIEGVGRVTAMEIISEFPGNNLDALLKFKDWWSNSNKHARPPENKVRAKLLKLVLGENFPDEKISDAYLKPDIDESTEKFTWGRPDLDALRDYTGEKFGWNKSKVDEALLPVIKKLGERDTQTHLDSFFTVSLKKQTELFPSKRMMSALKKITSPQKEGSSVETKAKITKRKPKSSVKKVAGRKAVCRTKQSKPQGPVLSEESSDEA